MRAQIVDAELSVIVATRARHGFLLRLLSSLAATDLAPSAEVLIVEDGAPYLSVSDLQAFAMRFRLRVIQNAERLGIAGARNAGITAASGSLLAFLDDDCVCDVRWAEALRLFVTHWQRSVFAGPIRADEGHPNLYSALREHVYYCETLGAEFLRPTSIDLVMITEPRQLPYASGGNSVYRADIFQRYGLFDERLPAHVDVEMGARLREEDRPALNRAMVVFHRHPSTFRAFLRRSFEAGRAKGLLCRAREHPGHRISTAATIVREIAENTGARNFVRAKRVTMYPFLRVWSVLTISEAVHGLGFLRGVISEQSDR